MEFYELAMSSSYGQHVIYFFVNYNRMPAVSNATGNLGVGTEVNPVESNETDQVSTHYCVIYS